jgi:ubiquitin carboxyl-terminal hydrolase 16/45
MLDSVRTEENRRVVAAICKQFSLDSNLPIEKQPKGVQPKILGNAVRAPVPMKINFFLAYAFSNDITFVDRIFGGQLLQTIKCAECGQISTRLESFLDLSLPIADQQVRA